MATASTPQFPGYPFYTLTRGGRDNKRLDSVKAYLSPYATVEVELFEEWPRISMDFPYNREHDAPKWEPTATHEWKEERCTKQEFMAAYNQVQAQLKDVFKAPPTMNRKDAFAASLNKQYPY